MRDGHFLAAGLTFNTNADGISNSGNMAIVRYATDGMLDTGFGAGGLVNLDLDGSSDNARAIKVLPGGGILVAGTLGTGSHTDFGLVKLHADGSLDTSFAAGGRVTVKYSSAADSDRPDALAIQSNGKLVASGYATNRATGTPHNDFYVVRVLANGAVDTDFGDRHGRVVVAVTNKDDGSYALAAEPSGNLLVGGYAQQDTAGQQRDFALLRLIGDPDRIFADSFEVTM